MKWAYVAIIAVILVATLGGSIAQAEDPAPLGGGKQYVMWEIEWGQWTKWQARSNPWVTVLARTPWGWQNKNLTQSWTKETYFLDTSGNQTHWLTMQSANKYYTSLWNPRCGSGLLVNFMENENGNTKVLIKNNTSTEMYWGMNGINYLGVITLGEWISFEIRSGEVVLRDNLNDLICGVVNVSSVVIIPVTPTPVPVTPVPATVTSVASTPIVNMTPVPTVANTNSTPTTTAIRRMWFPYVRN